MNNAQHAPQAMPYGGGMYGQTPWGQGQMTNQGQPGQSGFYPAMHQPGNFAIGGLMQPGYPAAAYDYQSYRQQPGVLSALGSDRFLKGLLIGAAAAYILTNESVQRSIIKGAVMAWTTLQGGLEEVKERFQDAEAELQAAEATRSEEAD